MTGDNPTFGFLTTSDCPSIYPYQNYIPQINYGRRWSDWSYASYPFTFTVCGNDKEKEIEILKLQLKIKELELEIEKLKQKKG